MLRFALVLALVACGGGQKTPYRDDVTQTLAMAPGTRAVAAPAVLEAKPWLVGQWVLYRMTKGAERGYMRYSVVGVAACGTWFEQVITTPAHRLVVKLCLPAAPDLTQIARAITQIDNRPPTILDKPPQGMSLGPDWVGKTDLPREDVRVPAGSFAQAVRIAAQVKKIDTTVWAHPEVPLGGAVKTVAANGLTTELLGYGDTGATSILATP